MSGQASKSRAAQAAIVPPAGQARAPEEAISLLALLKLEGEALEAKSLPELQQLIANDGRKLLRARQCFVFRRNRRSRLTLEAAAGLAEVDSQAPLVKWLESTLNQLARSSGLAEIREFKLDTTTYRNAADPTETDYPFKEAMWVPCTDRRQVQFAGFLLVRAEPWNAADQVLASRMGKVLAHAWYWLATSRPVFRPFAGAPKYWLAAAVTLVLLGAVPVPLTALAPVEILARDPFIVAAPMDGVVADVTVLPSEAVAPGQLLLHFDDVTLRNKLDVAERELGVAEARLRRTTLLAGSDATARHELGIAQAEVLVKSAERDFARDLLSRAMVTAPRAGIAIYGDRRDIVGRPVGTGERIMEIAQPEQVEARIEVPASDAIVFSTDKTAKIFLDAEPLAPREAVVVRADYQAKPTSAGTLAYRVTARLKDDARPLPRLGARGTAQLYGDTVPLGLFLLRRPITALRQWIGM